MLLSGGRYWVSRQTKSLFLEDIMGTFSKCLHHFRLIFISWSSSRFGRRALSLGSIRFNRLIIHLYCLPLHLTGWQMSGLDVCTLTRIKRMNELNHPISSILTKSEMNLLCGHGALAIGLDIAHYRDHQRLYCILGKCCVMTEEIMNSLMI